MKNHSLLVEKVLENAIGNDSETDDGTWTDVFEAANKKAETIEMAQVKLYYQLHLVLLLTTTLLLHLVLMLTVVDLH